VLITGWVLGAGSHTIGQVTTPRQLECQNQNGQGVAQSRISDYPLKSWTTKQGGPLWWAESYWL
ncbi:MAG: hypothetical protein V1897_12865, partial [Pseudomonadota bacterium]